MVLQAMAAFLLLLTVSVWTAAGLPVQVDPDDYIESVEMGEDTEGAHELDTFLPVRETPREHRHKTPPGGRRAELTDAAICAAIFCGAGRACVVENGQPRCACAVQCPRHYSALCGTDGVTYGNKCELERAACMRNVRIDAASEGPCPEPPTDPLPPQPEEKPLVCYEIERDQLRQLLIDWMKGRVEHTGRRTPGKSYAEVLTENFRSCDSNGDDELDGMEFVSCVEKNETIADFTGDRPAQGHQLRGLCVDALILMSDANEDWVLDLEEFRRCMDPDFTPPRKQCSLENELYEDGAETRVDCNICVCACGNWVCSAVSCDEVEDYSLFEPYDVEQGPLPSREERYRLLQGFIAAEHVNLDRIEHEVTHNLQQVTDDVTVATVTSAPGKPTESVTTQGEAVETTTRRPIGGASVVTTPRSHTAAEIEASTPEARHNIEGATASSLVKQPRTDGTESEAAGVARGGSTRRAGPHQPQRQPLPTPSSPWQHAGHVIPTQESDARIPIISFNITVSEHHVIHTADAGSDVAGDNKADLPHPGPQADQAPGAGPLPGPRHQRHHHHHHHGDGHRQHHHLHDGRHPGHHQHQVHRETSTSRPVG